MASDRAFPSNPHRTNILPTDSEWSTVQRTPKMTLMVTVVVTVAFSTPVVSKG